jgi:type II secretory pathway pseudopilin PulG
MRLVDQDNSREPSLPGAGLDDGGFIMVALLVGIAVSALWMTVLLPSWKQQETREREAELIFRGEQYARAIYLYRQKNQIPPPDIDTLVNQRFLRKKYLDPITGKEFLPLAGVTAGAPAGRAGGAAPQLQTGLTGVRSTSNESSIVIYLNQSTYSQFPFDWTVEAQRAGRSLGPGPGTGPGAPNGRGTDRGTGPGRGGPGGVGPGQRGTAPAGGRGPGGTPSPPPPGSQRGFGPPASAPARGGR